MEPISVFARFRPHVGNLVKNMLKISTRCFFSDDGVLMVMSLLRFVLRYLDDEEYAAGAAATFPSRGRVEFAEREYTFADVFAGQGGGADEQAAIYESVGRPLVDAALDGINPAVVA